MGLNRAEIRLRKKYDKIVLVKPKTGIIIT